LCGAAAAAEWFQACAACGADRVPLALAGFVLYAGLFGIALSRGPSNLVLGGVLFAFGVHASLMVQMLLARTVCGFCITAAAGSLGLVGLSIAVDRANLGRLALLLPWAALLVAVGLGLARPAAPPVPA